MRQTIKRVSKSTVSIILSVMMIVSMMLVGMVATVNAATIPANTTIYFDATSAASNFTQPYMSVTSSSNQNYSADENSTSGAGSYVPKNDGTTWIKMTKVTGNIWKATVTSQSTVGKLSFYNKDMSSYNNIWQAHCTLGRTYDGSNNLLTLGTTGTYHTDRQSYIYGGSWSTYTESGGDDDSDISADLLAVLKGEKVMFYGAEREDWNQSTFYVMNSNSTGDVAATGNCDISFKAGTTDMKGAAFCLPVKDYFMGHWASNLNTTVEAGATYIVRGSTSTTGYTQKDSSGSDYLYSYNNGATLTATTTCASSIQAGESLSVSTSSSAGTSTIGENNTFKYYIGDSAGNYQACTLSNGKIDTSELEAGTYTLKTVLYDGNIYVVGDTDTFTVTSECSFTSTVNGEGTVSYSVGSTAVNPGDKLQPGSVVTVSPNPATGYKLTSIVAGTDITTSKQFTLDSDTTVTVTFSLIAPTVSLSASEQVYIGESCDITASVDSELAYTGVYTVTKNGNSVDASTYISNDTFSTPCADSSAGTYVITYTATINDNGNTAADSKSVTINVARSAEQIAYNSIVGFLADASNDPDNMSGKKPSTLNAYRTAYEAAEALVGTYPSANGTACQTAYTNLETAYGALEDLISLDKPVLNTSVDEVDLNSENTSLTLTVANASSYPANANVTYTFYQNDEVLTTTTDSSVTLELSTAGAYTYYVKVTVGNTDEYFCSPNTSETKTVNAVKYFNVSVESVSNANVKVVDTSSTEITQALYGDTVQVQVTVTNASYKCTGITVTPSVSVTNNGDGSYKFTMPASDVTVKATIVEKTKYTVTASSNDTNLGTVAPASATVYEGNEVTLTATPVGDSTFKNWTITGTYEISSGTTSSTVFKIIPTSNITATATFEEDLGTPVTGRYLVYGTSNNNPTVWAASTGCTYVPIYEMSDGSWVAKLDADDFDTGKDYYFALSSSTNYLNMYWTSTDGNVSDIKVKSTDTSLATAGASNYGLGSGADYRKYRFGNFKADGTVSSIKITCSQSITDSYQYIVEPFSNIPSDAIKVYAKDGATLSGGTGDYGDTTLTTGYIDGTSADKHTYYDVFYVSPEGGIITIQTTVDSTRHAGGYYVYAYVINGQTVTTASKGNGVYESTYSVPAGIEEVEITPVYYNKNIEAAGDYITFYVDASELGEHWGNIVACYSYYYMNGTDNSGGTKHGDGGYPGQPMLLNANGKYFTKLSRYYYDSSGNKTSYAISGITLNNFYENDLHSNFLSSSKDQKHNYQTYDYDDFVEIANIEGIDTIQFDVKYRTKTTNQSALNNGNTGATDSGSISISTFSNSSYNGWDDLTDYDGNLVDIQGNPVTNMNNKIYIVSTGNQYTPVGQWSTEWYVYNASGTYITQGNPSDFIPRPNSANNTSAYNMMSSYAGYYTQICYESEMNADSASTNGGSNNNTGIRCDGRWYYTNSRNNQAVVDTQIWYSDDNGANYTKDETRTKGSATVDGEISKTFEQRNVEATLNAIAGNGYSFVEWGIVDDNGENYKTISSAATSQFFVDTNYHLVAKFVKIQDNTLVLSHQKYAGPDAKGGFGFYYISAKHYDSNGNETPYAKTEGNINIPVNSTDDRIEITLTTTMSGVNTFIDWYEYANDQYQIIGPDDNNNFDKTGSVEYTFTVSIKDIYGDNVNDLLVQTLSFFSDIAPVTADAVLNYKYYNRFNEERTYTIKTTLSDDHIKEHGLKITDDMIYDNAPAIDDLHKDCKWQITDEKLTLTGTSAVLWAIQDRKRFNVSIDDQVNPGYEATVYLNDYIALNSSDILVGVPVRTDDYAFVTAPAANDDNQPFSYWLVTENGSEVARCYFKEFNLKISGDYVIEAVYGETGDSLTISDAVYSREQFTNADGSIATDYLYADFILAYMPANGILLNGVHGTEYKTGVIIEFDRYITLGVTDADGNKLTDAQKKEFKDTELIDVSVVKDFALSGTSSKIFDPDGDGSNNRALYNYVVDNSKYNNKNRLDYYIRYKNTAANRQYVYRAYYYVITPENEVLITNPVYFYLYDIGNSIVSNS